MYLNMELFDDTHDTAAVITFVVEETFWKTIDHMLELITPRKKERFT